MLSLNRISKQATLSFLLASSSQVSLAASELNYGASLTSLYDDNVFKVNEDEETDLITTLSAFGNYVMSMSKQTLEFGVVLSNAQYQNRNSLNNTGHILSADWYYQANSKLSNSISFNRQTRISDFSDFSGTTKNEITSNLLSYNLNFQPYSKLQFGLNLTQRTSENTVDRLDRSVNEMLASVNYQIGSKVNTGLLLSKRDSTAKNDGNDELNNTQHQTTASVTWNPSSRSSWGLNVSQVDNAINGSSNYNLNYSHTLGAKSAFSASIFKSTSEASDEFSAFTDEQGYNLSYNVSASSKITYTLNLTQSDITGDAALDSQTVGYTDKYTAYSLSVGYGMSRMTVINAKVQHEERLSSGRSAGATTAYEANTIQLNVNLRF